MTGSTALAAEAPLRVGFVGAGLVVQAIHIPTLSRMRGEFEIAVVHGQTADSARRTAERAGARWTTSVDAVLDDPDIDVVAVCTPRELHAEHVIAAMRAGKKAVLCEKPLTGSVEQAEAIRAVSEETGVPVIVAAMHVHDPAWAESRNMVDALAPTVSAVRSNIVLPPTGLFVGLSTQFTPPAQGPGLDDQLDDRELAALSVRTGVLELGTHDIPMIRRFLPDWRDARVVSAAPVAPFGYDITVRAGDRVATLLALLHDQWRSRWEFEAISPAGVLRLDFTPSWVHAGSGIAHLDDGGSTSRTVGPRDANGYEGEWLTVRRAVRESDSMIAELRQAVDDITFAIDLTEQATELLLTGPVLTGAEQR